MAVCITTCAANVTRINPGIMHQEDGVWEVRWLLNEMIN